MEPTNTVTYFVRSYFCYVCVGRSKKLKVKSLSHVRLCDSMDCSLPGSSVHGIFLARVLEWGAIAFSLLIIHTHIYSICSQAPGG